MRTRRFGWDEIVRFEPPRPYGKMFNAGLGARLANGTLATSSLYAAGPLNSRHFADRVLSILNGLLVDRLADDGSDHRS